MTIKGGPYCFSQSYTGLSNTIITDCGVSLPYDISLGNNIKLPVRKTFKALWDTGATNTVICKNVVDSLNLKPTGKTQTHNAAGSCIVDTFSVNIYLPNNITFHNLSVTHGIFNGFDILIGMDVINNGDFSITNFNKKTSFSFRIPSLCAIDFLKDHQNNVPIPKPSIDHNQSPNDKCLCGSNKKFKHCCGKKY